MSQKKETLATPGLLPDGFIFLEIAPKVLPMGRLPKAVVSTMNESATGSYVCLTGGPVDRGLTAFIVGVWLTASCGRTTAMECTESASR